MSNEKRAPGSLFRVIFGDAKLPRYMGMGIAINH